MVTVSMCKVTVSAPSSVAGASWSFVTANSMSSDDTVPAVPCLLLNQQRTGSKSQNSEPGLGQGSGTFLLRKQHLNPEGIQAKWEEGMLGTKGSLRCGRGDG